MKMSAVTALVVAACAGCGVALEATMNPIPRIVKLVKELKKECEHDQAEESNNYDQFACWCEETLKTTGDEISHNKELIEAKTTSITKLEGEVGAYGADVAQLKEDVQANKDAMNEAQQLREKEIAEFEAEKKETKQCIGALGVAIGVLSGHSLRTGFLSMPSSQQTTIVESVRGVLAQPLITSSASIKALQAMEQFVQSPADYFRKPSGLSTIQIKKDNPHGDYVTQSDPILGILQQMKEDFETKQNKEDEKEAEQNKNFQQLFATKTAEGNTLAASLATTELTHAAKKKEHAEDNQARDNANTLLATLEKEFATTKSSCKQKATEWAERMRLRTQELQGINEAIGFLDSPKFEKLNIYPSFTQLSMSSTSRRAQRAYAELVEVSRRFPNAASLVQMAAAAKSRQGWHFERVLKAIDSIIADLRTEEANDIKMRDRCEEKMNKNRNDGQDAEHLQDKTDAQIGAAKEKVKSLQDAIVELEKDIGDTKKEREELVKFFKGERATVRQNLQDHKDGIALIENAIVSIADFYKKNKIDTGLIQAKGKAPPKTWDTDYKGKNTETGGVMAILSLIKEDMQKAYEELLAKDKADQAKFDEGNQALADTLSSQEKSMKGLKNEKNQVENDQLELEGKFDSAKEEGSDQEKLGQALENECGAILDHLFEERRSDRKAEIEGLEKARAWLAGKDMA